MVYFDKIFNIKNRIRSNHTRLVRFRFGSIIRYEINDPISKIFIDAYFCSNSFEIGLNQIAPTSIWKIDDTQNSMYSVLNFVR